jgi:uncharacterized protein YhbP (UPF0306 family)
MTAVSSSRTMPDEVVEYLARHHVVTISTSSFTGLPHADTVIYANDGRSFFFYVAEGTEMMRNIKDSRHVSVTIDDYTIEWRKLRELQGVGRCLPAETEEHALADVAFGIKFGSHFATPPGTLYRMVPSRLHFVDYDYTSVHEAEPQVRTYELADTPPPPSQGPIATSLDQLEFAAGEIIFRPGTRENQYFVVLEGEVEVRSEGYGVDQTVIHVGPGELFGDQAALRGQPGGLTAHAVTRTTALKVDRNAMRELLMG